MDIDLLWDDLYCVSQGQPLPDDITASFWHTVGMNKTAFGTVNLEEKKTPAKAVRVSQCQAVRRLSMCGRIAAPEAMT